MSDGRAEAGESSADELGAKGPSRAGLAAGLSWPTYPDGTEVAIGDEVEEGTVSSVAFDGCLVELLDADGLILEVLGESDHAMRCEPVVRARDARPVLIGETLVGRGRECGAYVVRALGAPAEFGRFAIEVAPEPGEEGPVYVDPAQVEHVTRKAGWARLSADAEFIADDLAEALVDSGPDYELAYARARGVASYLLERARSLAAERICELDGDPWASILSCSVCGAYVARAAFTMGHGVPDEVAYCPHCGARVKRVVS